MMESMARDAEFNSDMTKQCCEVLRVQCSECGVHVRSITEDLFYLAWFF